eukprot:CAMPEP_0181233598 /NCGR_PEP_ID=MMETSP1096-20121128/36433_1 /TAXON_ID=156174 ORGANISM="Chrysochromulina ericina, Strain CCMP281" /NCGR_SAMPLE_ID=MMETSP1096 /ASSEMBLY_ACC=CAM_ASM_000453 /LENGTH=34 /DNA_ID= /DNA_START= /DNA_END= /DNA_ORIENTATION=
MTQVAETAVTGSSGAGDGQSQDGGQTGDSLGKLG